MVRHSVKLAADMTLARREGLKSSQFAVPESKAKKIGVAGEIQGESKGKYPIPDRKHAKNALARVSQHGTPAERAAVRSKVYRKYPDLRAGFEERHGGESPISKSNVRKVEQGGISKEALGVFADELVKIAKWARFRRATGKLIDWRAVDKARRAGGGKGIVRQALEQPAPRSIREALGG